MSSPKHSTSRKPASSVKPMVRQTMKRAKGGATAALPAVQKISSTSTLLPAVQTGQILPYPQPAP